MGKLAFYGILESGDLQKVSRLLGEWMAAERLDVKVRLGGEEIVCESDKVYFYCQTGTPSPGGEPRYLLEGQLSGTPEEARELLERLLASCKREGITSRFEYVPVDDDGNEIGDQIFVE